MVVDASVGYRMYNALSVCLENRWTRMMEKREEDVCREVCRPLL